MRVEGRGSRVEDILENYAVLMEDLDRKCAEVYSRAPEIPCKNKCFDCCKQLFPVSFVEAFYISEGLKNKVAPFGRSNEVASLRLGLMDRALRRKRLRVAKKIAEKIRAENPWQFERRGVSRTAALNTHAEFAKFLHAIESDCPALDPKNPAGACTVYSFRNHDCRSMGFSFDRSANVIVGCFRFAKLGRLIPRLMDFGYRYPEKMALDRELISELTAGAFTPNILYYTTMCGPLIKDYAAENWLKFFSEKGVPEKSGADEYYVVIDV